MRVGLNATCFNDQPSGARQRFVGLYRAIATRRPDIEFVIFEPADCRVGDWFRGARNVTARQTSLPSDDRLLRSVGGLTYWRNALKRERLDLFEQSHLPLIKAPDCPTILTIHDPRSVLPEVPPLKRMLPRAIYRHAFARADHIVTVSETMRLELLGLGAKMPVTSIYNGIDPVPFRQVPAKRAAATGQKFDLAGEFLLAVGHLEPRKNYARLIEAVALLDQRGQATHLVIVGNDAGDGAALREQIKQRGLESRVRLLHGVSDQELADIYALSSLVVFPSRYEGFGIPVLEAMAANRPLVLSDIAVFRELTEGQGAYFPADDSAAMAAQIAAVLGDEWEQRRLVAYGEQRLRNFGYPSLAAELDDLYISLTG